MNPKTTVKRQIRRAKVGKALKPRRLIRFVGLTAVLFIAGVCCLTVLPPMAIQMLGLPHPTLPTWGQGLRVYDRNDKQVCTIYGEKDQQPLHFNEISSNVKHAIIAAEDHEFYSHDGIDPVGIGRALMVDLAAHKARQGGSTISQQLVKNLYYEGKKRNLVDKVSEALMAIDMEHRYSKDEILEAYLNCVYFGQGVYGVERASEHYFGKRASKLDIAEAAYVAGLVNAPSELSDPSNRQRAVERQHLVLNSMEEMDFATPAEVKKAKAERLIFRAGNNSSRQYRYYTSEVIQQLRKDLGVEDPYSSGYRVYTYLDPAAQAEAEHNLASGIRRAPHGINQGALVSISVKDGGVVAMVGGAGAYDKNQWNRATSPHTAGSAFKPFVYLAGLSQGVLHPDTMLVDEPLEIKQPGSPVYSPRNYDGTYLGPITIRKALALSRNTCAVKVAQEVGPGEIVKYAQAAGISSRLDPNLSLALGSSAVSPLEMANAYATLARGGEFIDARMVRRVEDANGHVLKDYQQQHRQAFESEPVAELVDALQDVVEHGTGTRARLFDRPVAGKTGTADGAKDIWFIGFTPDMVTAVWGGNDDNRPVPGHATGGTVMAGIWQDYMRAYYRDHNVPAGEFPQPEHPLMVDPEQLHELPTPADIFNRLFGGITGPAPEVREYHWRPAPRRVVVDEDGVPIGRPHRGLIRRFFDWLDF